MVIKDVMVRTIVVSIYKLFFQKALKLVRPKLIGAAFGELPDSGTVRGRPDGNSGKSFEQVAFGVREHLKVGHIDQAFALSSEAISRRPRSLRAHRLHLEVLEQVSVGGVKKSIQKANEGLKRDASILDVLALAEEKLSLGCIEEAFECSSEALSRSPNSAKVRRLHSEILIGLRRFAEAEALLSEHLESNPLDTKAIKLILKCEGLQDNRGAEGRPLDGLIANLAAKAFDSIYVVAVLQYESGDFVSASKSIKSVPAGALVSSNLLSANWQAMTNLGRYDLALQGLKIKLASMEQSESLSSRIEHTLFSQSTYETYARYIEEYPTPNPNGYVVLFDLGHRVANGLMVPITYALLRSGYAVCSAVSSSMPKSPLSEFDGISALIRGDGTAINDRVGGHSTLLNDWVLDWDNGEVSCDGINYFPFFLERISKLGKCYRADLRAPGAQELFDDLLRRSDFGIELCKRLLKLAELGKPIRIAAMDTHFAPWGVVRRWCDSVGKDFGIHMVALSSGYENYFSNLSSIEARTIAVENMTANSTLRHPFLGGAERFEKFLEEDPSVLSGRDDVLQWIKMDRSRTASSNFVQRKVVTDRIKGARESGRKVFAAFGKVLIDFAAPDDRGRVFSDFPEWILFLVEAVERSDALLIVKPHPHEIRREIAMEGVETMRDLLPDTLPDSVIFLDHDAFNSYELAELVDVSFIWNGTISCEFPVLGCPVVAESVWADRDYPVGSHIVRSQKEYMDIIDGKAHVPLSEHTRDRAAAFLRFMGSRDVSIPFKYVRRAGTNKPIGANKLYFGELKQLEREGDPSVDLIVSRFFECL